MVNLSIHDGSLFVEVLGTHKIWALKSRLQVPLSAVRDVVACPDIKVGWWHGARLPGTHVPGLIIAGSYLKDGQWSFWDVRRPRNTLAIRLEGHRYQMLYVEVADPVETLQQLQEALAAP